MTDRSMTGGQRVRMVVNLLNLSTPLGVLLAAVTRTPLARGPGGLILGTGYTPRLPVASAFTVGNVVIYRAGRCYIDARPALLAHEARHSSQYACFLGLPLLSLYGLCALWSLWRTGDPGSRNPFERHAGLEAGGYTERATVQRFARAGAAKTSEVPQ